MKVSLARKPCKVRKLTEELSSFVRRLAGDGQEVAAKASAVPDSSSSLAGGPDCKQEEGCRLSLWHLSGREGAPNGARPRLSHPFNFPSLQGAGS